MQPFTVSEGAVGIHEWYISLRSAGFKWYEALYFIAQVIRDPSGGESENGK